jgi:phage I-like protein
MPSPTAIAVLNQEIGPDAAGVVPDEAHLLPAGRFRASDGRPHNLTEWVLDATTAAQVVARAAARKNDILVDYEHQSINAKHNGQPAPAAGWAAGLEFRGTGLYAINIRWTARARQMIASREYRYISSAFTYGVNDGRVRDILSIALTNTPALDGLDALTAALSRLNPDYAQQQETPMTEQEQQQQAALKAERDRIQVEAVALKAAHDKLQTEQAALTKERDEARAKLAKIEADAQIAALAAEKVERDGLLAKVPPTLKASLETMPLAALKEHVEKIGVLGWLTQQSDGKGGSAVAALTAEETALCEKLSVSREDFLRAKGVTVAAPVLAKTKDKE